MNTYEIIIFSLTTFYVVLMFFYLIGWLRLKELKLQTTNHKPQTFASIIISARNEEANIENCVNDILAQNFPKELFEVIVVDDFSTDKTVSIIEEVKSANLRLIRLSEFLLEQKINSFKKKAIEIGIQNSKGDLIITTDADCRMGKNWLASIVSFYEKKKPKMISAPVSFSDATVSSGSIAIDFFQKFQSFDLMGMIGIGAASLANGNPLMCNGANLAYEKKVFEVVGGFKGIDDIASGDDMLLLHKIAEKYYRQISFLKNKEAIVHTHPEPTLKDFFNQRIRWASKSVKYKNKWITLILAMVFLFNFSILINFLLGFLYGIVFWKLFCFSFFIKIFLDFIFLNSLSNFFGEKKLFWLFLPSQILHILYIIIIGLAANFGKYRWKGRTVK